MSQKPYFAPALPHVLAHRGLHIVVPENTLASFSAALDAGATHIETDAHVSSDGVAVLVHDPVIEVGGVAVEIAALTALELAALDLGSGEGIPTLEQTLARFPRARFNIDIKTPKAAEAVASAVKLQAASNRVLIASFDNTRRKAALSQLPGAATSASAMVSLLAVLVSTVGLTGLRHVLFRGIDAVQLPTHMLRIPVFTRRFISMCHRSGVVVQVWTINEPELMKVLLARGVDGIVTDRCDLAVTAVAERSRASNL